MAANTSPIFGLNANCRGSLINSANTSRDGSGTLIDAFVAGTNGSILYRMTFTNASAAVGAGVLKVVRVFITDATGANPKLYREAILAAVTSSNTVAGQTVSFTIADGLFLATGQKVQISQSLRATSADDTHCFAEGADY